MPRGVNGYHINYKVYDSASTPAGGLNAARETIADHVFADVVDSTGIAGGLQTLAAANMPTIGDGDLPNWADEPTLFSISGQIVLQNTTAWMQVLVQGGHGRIAIPGGTLNPQAVTNWEHLVPQAGGTLCFSRIGIDGTNTASVVAVAHEIVSAHCTGVASPTLYPGTEALQAALNELSGGKIPVVEAGDIGNAVLQQYGKTINNMIYANFFASAYDTADPGVVQYLNAMKTYQPTHNPYCFCEKGYPVAEWFLHSLGQVQGTPTQAALVAALNNSSGYTANGLVGPISEPAFHHSGSLCLSYSTIQNGQWAPLIGGPNPFICGKPFVG
jgi:hypothetical protein